jgi:hypothetical protein
MTRKIRALGLSLLALAAIGATTSSAAEAVPKIEVSEHAVLIGVNSKGKHVLASGSRQLECDAAIDGGLSGSTSELTVAPTFSNCQALVFGLPRPATFTPNHCEYTYQNMQTAGTSWTATVDILCENPGEEMEAHIYENEGKHKEKASLCTVKVPPQQDIGTVVFSNMTEASPADITIDMTLASMQYNVSGSAFICGTSSSNATYTGTFTMHATNTSNKAIPIGISGE